MRKAIVVAAVGLLLLTGCSKSDGEVTERVRVVTVNVDGGRSVTCVTLAAGYRGGISCDWDNAR